MGKLAVAFFTVVAFQAAFGGVTRRLDLGEDELKTLLQKIERVSVEVIEKIRNSPHDSLIRDCRLFEDRFEDILSHLDELTTMGDIILNTIVEEVREEFRHFRRTLNYVHSLTDIKSRNNLQIDLCMRISNIVRQLDRIVMIAEENSSESMLYTDIQKILRVFLNALLRLRKEFDSDMLTGLNDYKPHQNIRNLYGGKLKYLELDMDDSTLLERKHNLHKDNWSLTEFDATNKNTEHIVRMLDETLQRIDFNDVAIVHTLKHLICKYLESLENEDVPEARELLFQMRSIELSSSVAEIKMLIVRWVENQGHVEHVSGRRSLAFWKATHKLVHRISTMTKVDKHLRHLILHIRADADSFTNSLEVISNGNEGIEEVGVLIGRHLAKHLEQFVLKLGQTKDDCDNTENLRKVINKLENDSRIDTIMICIQEATTEVHKWLISCADTEELAYEVLTDFVKLLHSQMELVRSMFKKIDRIDIWSMHLRAFTSKLGMYLRGEENMEQLQGLLQNVKHLLKALENGKSAENTEVIQRLRKTVLEFERGVMGPNDFLQRVALVLNQFMWDISEGTGRLPSEVREVILHYLVKIVDLHKLLKVNKALQTVQTPEELVFKIQDAADRLTTMIHIYVPGFKHTKLAYQTDRMVQVIRIMKHRLHEVLRQDGKSDRVVERVYENLREIQNKLEICIGESDIDIKVKLPIYIQDAVKEIKLLAFGECTGRGTELVKMYGDFLFGVEHIQNQLQYNLQTPSEKHSVNTLTMQTQSVAHRLSTLLQRAQLKPQLKRMILNEIYVLDNEMSIAMDSVGVSGNRVFEESSVALNELKHLIKWDSTNSVADLSVMLDKLVWSVVSDLSRISNKGQLYIANSNGVYRFTLSVISNIMIRVQNAHLEYSRTMNTREILDQVRRISRGITSELHNLPGNGKTIRYDVMIQVLRYAHHVEKVIACLEIETKVNNQRLLEILSAVHDIARRTLVTNLDEIKLQLDALLRAFEFELENIVERETSVGTKKALTKYLVAVEQLFVHMKHILIRSEETLTDRRLIKHVETHAYYLARTVERINPDNKRAIKILRTEYRRLVEFLAPVEKQLRDGGKLTASHAQNIFNKYSVVEFHDTKYYNDVDHLKIKISMDVKRMLVVLRELFLVLHEDHSVGVRRNYLVGRISDMGVDAATVLGHFLTVIQRMHIQIDTHILIEQKNLNSVVLLNRKSGLGYYDETSGKRTLPIQMNSERYSKYGYDEPNNWKLIKQINNMVVDVIYHLQNSITDLQDKHISMNLMQQLMQTIEYIVDRLEGDRTELSSHQLLNKLKEVKTELRRATTSGIFYQTKQMQYLLVDAIKTIFDDIKGLGRIIPNVEDSVWEHIARLFGSCIRNIKHEIECNTSHRITWIDELNTEYYENPFSYRILKDTVDRIESLGGNLHWGKSRRFGLL